MPTTVLDSYHYSHQLRSYIVQFAAIFAGLQVSIGKNAERDERFIHVPVKNASMDRVVAAIKSENTQNKPIRLPIMSFQLVGVEQSPEARKGIGTVRRNTTIPIGGQFPEDIKVIEQRMPVPYTAMFELAIWASNQDQHYQIMEQIFTLFDPSITIQKSDDIYDWTRLTKVELTDIRFDENMPAGSDRRMIQTRLSFIVPIWLAIPNNVHKKFIEEINLRIGAVGTDVNNSFDIIADLDSQGEEYKKVFDLNDIDID